MAPSKQVDLIAILYPRPGKEDRVATLLGEMCVWVHANEPRTLQYKLFRQSNRKTGLDELIMLESYEDKDAINAHGSTPQFRAFYELIDKEDLVRAPTELKFVKAITGFSSRL